MPGMDKVDYTTASLFNTPLNKSLKKETKKSETGFRSGKKTLFSSIFENYAQPAGELGPLRELEPSEEALTLLMDSVRSAGDDLIDRPFHEEILRYKKAVRDFIHYVVENGYELQKIQGIKKKIVLLDETTWRANIYQQIRVIDEELDRWASKLLSEQTTKLERVSKIDEIKGLLVDLTITGAIRERDE